MDRSQLVFRDGDVRIVLPGNPAHAHRRVTLVIYGLGPGGAERVLLRLGQGLMEREWLATLVTLNPGVPDFYRVPDGMVRVEAPVTHSRLGPLDLRGHLAKERLLRRVLLGTTPHVVVSFLTETNLRVLTALAGTRIPVVVSERVAPGAHPVSRSVERLRRLLYPRAERVVLVSAESLPWAERAWPGARLCAIGNPVLAPSLTTQDQPEWLRSPVVVSVGRLTEQKGYRTLLEAFSLVASRFPEWHLAIVGEGEDRAHLERRIVDLGLTGRVKLPGLVEDVQAVLAHSDLFVLSSLYEGFPGALAEALAAGLPVVASDCPGSVRQLVRDGVEGLLVPPADAVALAGAMARLMGDQSLRHAMGKAASTVVERFALDAVMAEWEETLIDAVATPPRRELDIARLLRSG